MVCADGRGSGNPNMSTFQNSSRIGRARALCFLGVPVLLVVLAGGCGKSASTVKVNPVSGLVTLAGKPLDGGLVIFIPDNSKGNTTPNSPVSTIGSDGKYALNYGPQEGRPRLVQGHRVHPTTPRGPRGKKQKHPQCYLSEPRPDPPDDRGGGLSGARPVRSETKTVMRSAAVPRHAGRF